MVIAGYRLAGLLNKNFTDTNQQYTVQLRNVTHITERDNQKNKKRKRNPYNIVSGKKVKLG
jgi:hypothetical protein